MLRGALRARRAPWGVSGKSAVTPGPDDSPKQAEIAADIRDTSDNAERRMQLRAFEAWDDLTSNPEHAAPRDMLLRDHPDLAAHSALFDFSVGAENPALPLLGRRLAAQCGIEDGTVARLSDLPDRSLLRRVADQYFGVLPGEDAIGFEAQYTGVDGATLLYRGILLPVLCEAGRLAYVYSVINWKSIGGQQVAETPAPQIDTRVIVSADEVAAARLALILLNREDNLDLSEPDDAAIRPGREAAS